MRRPHEMIDRIRRSVDMLDGVRDGLGAAYLTNLLQKIDPGILDKFEEGSDESSKKKPEPVTTA